LAEYLKALPAGFWLSDLIYASTYGNLGEQKQAAAAIASLHRKKPGYSLADALRQFRKFPLQDGVLEKRERGLRAAGLR
jgi:hypothetical protein